MDSTDVTAGHSWGKGRGFTAYKNEEGFGDCSSSGFGDERGRGRGRGGGRGRGRGHDENRGDRGYRGGRSGNDSYNNSGDGGWSNSRDDYRRNNDDNRRYDNGNENSRGDSRNDGDWNDNKDDRPEGDSAPEGKMEPVTYVPTERTEDELLSEGIERGINFDNYEKIDVKITGQNAPKPINSFADARFRELIITNLRKCRYDKPTPIQKHAIPIVMAGRDLMATAQTGSGKTAAFLLPIISSLLSGDCDAPGGKCCSPQALILSPTRELAIQIKDNAKLYTAQSSLKVEILYGGVATKHQGTRISMGCNIMIATPGRLNDFVNRGWVKFDAIQFLVLDEADRMLDMGFSAELKNIVNHESMTPSGERQTLMFSATFSTTIQKLASQYLRPNYIFVAVGEVGGACQDVEQNFVRVERHEKKNALTEILKAGDCHGTLVFVATQIQADFLATFISQKDIKTTSIHGKRFQYQREAALNDFRSRRMSVLVATNVAARGLDIGGVKHVINFDLPTEVDEYVHRIGRTGRLGNRGKATSFYDPGKDAELANDLIRILKQANQDVPDFLLNDGTGGGDYEHSKFGGTDYRKSGNTDFGNDGAKTGEMDEVWD